MRTAIRRARPLVVSLCLAVLVCPLAAKAADAPAVPKRFSPWWEQPVGESLTDAPPLRMGVESVILGTLMHSPQVRVLSDEPVIRRTAITEAEARFDPRTFMESKFIDTSDPVGSSLTTGGADRYIDQTWTYSAGVRKRTLTGVQLEASQKIGYQDNNSIFFVPNQQGTGRLSLSFTQPLLNGFGKAYNESLIVIAEIETAAAYAQLTSDLETLLLDVHRAYWGLYLERTALLQKRKFYRMAVDIQQELEARREVDVVDSQIARASAAVAMREAAAIRGETMVKNAESRLRALIDDPALSTAERVELVPIEQPNPELLNVDLHAALATALAHRAEIDRTAKDIHAAAIRADMAEHDLLPILDLVLETYVSGLEGQSDVGTALEEQFNEGRPSYTAGLRFEVPYGNRAAKARLLRRRVEVRRLTSQLAATMAAVRSEVEIAVREVATSYHEMLSREQAMAASESEIRYLSERWRLLPGDQQLAGVLLSDLLSSQDRLAAAELGFASAHVAYQVASIDLKRATGTLLDFEAITRVEACEGGLPAIILDKQRQEIPVESIVPQPTSGLRITRRLPPVAP